VTIELVLDRDSLVTSVLINHGEIAKIPATSMFDAVSRIAAAASLHSQVFGRKPTCSCPVETDCDCDESTGCECDECEDCFKDGVE
jgi:hypothetical protein